jgi:hypothetical protein
VRRVVVDARVEVWNRAASEHPANTQRTPSSWRRQPQSFQSRRAWRRCRTSWISSEYAMEQIDGLLRMLR